jgi:hypothetical protein
MDKELINFLINDARCEAALSDYLKAVSTEEWVYQNMQLFNAVSIRVNGLPSIASCNYQGKHFGNIKEFHTFFRNAMDVMDDPFGSK